MEGLAVMGFVFGMVGVVALVRLEKLTKTLKEKGILEENYKEEKITTLNNSVTSECCRPSLEDLARAYGFAHEWIEAHILSAATSSLRGLQPSLAIQPCFEA